MKRAICSDMVILDISLASPTYVLYFANINKIKQNKNLYIFFFLKKKKSKFQSKMECVLFCCRCR